MRDLPNSLKAKEVFSVTNIESLSIYGTDWNSELIWIYCCKLGKTLTNFSFFINLALKYCIKNIRLCFGDYIVLYNHELNQDKFEIQLISPCYTCLRLHYRTHRRLELPFGFEMLWISKLHLHSLQFGNFERRA